MKIVQKETIGSKKHCKRNPLSLAVRRALGIGNAALLLSISPIVSSNGPFGPVLELSDLDGSDGFVINGIDAGDSLGRSVSNAGDINGDGVGDLIIGAFLADPNGGSSGESYVVFGGSGVGSTGVIELSALDGSDGFVLNGIDAGEHSGISVSSAGDINGDGVGDLIIGANLANANSIDTGESYVVFGGGGVGSTGVIELSALDGSDGFVLYGIDAYDYSSSSVSSAGDVNGDGVGDLIIGADLANPNGSISGESYVVFGGGGVGTSGVIELSDLDGSNGFVLNGIDAYDQSGGSVSSAGDINDDGVGDLIIGAGGAEPNGSRSGESYLLFGGGGVGSTGVIELSDLDGSNGFVLNGIDTGDSSGSSVSGVGDINGDGVADLIIGALYADPNGNFSGESYVVFGGGGVGSSGVLELSALDGSDGFVLNGIDANDRSGISVSSAGDINGDGLGDLIIGAYHADPNGNNSGESYVVFGGGAIGGTGVIELSVLDGSDGFVLNGIGAFDFSGESVSSAGDINDDGVGDLIIGADLADPNGSNSGESYVVFGKQQTPTCNGLIVTVNFNLGQSTTPDDDVVLGTDGDDDIRGKAGNDTICGGGGDDFIHGNSGNDWIDGGDGVDNIRGGQGDDLILTGLGSTVGTGSRAFGGTGDDEITGDADDDDIRGGRGMDIINARGGDDLVYGNDDGDDINGGLGFDTIVGGQGDDELNGGSDSDNLSGGSGNDSLSGGADNGDVCDGGTGTDTATASCETVFNVP